MDWNAVPRLRALVTFALMALFLPGAVLADGGPALATFWRSVFARPDAARPDAAPAAIPAPADAPMTAARIALGKRLFEAPELSAGHARSCRSCHDPDRAFTDGRPRPAAHDGGDLARNAPTLLDLAWAKALMWDGRADSLEAQVVLPLLDPREMAGSWPDIVLALKRSAEIDVAFHVAFSERPAIQPATIIKALAAYVRSLVSPLSRFDQWAAGDDTALSSLEMRGFALFVGKAGCVACHGGWRFTDDKFHDIGLPIDAARPDLGRGASAGGAADGVPGLPAFKTPTLRGLPLTAPYMHDGSKPTLASVLDHYAASPGRPAGLLPRPSLDASLRRDLALDDGERVALLAFLAAISAPAATR